MNDTHDLYYPRIIFSNLSDTLFIIVARPVWAIRFSKNIYVDSLSKIDHAKHNQNYERVGLCK